MLKTLETSSIAVTIIILAPSLALAQTAPSDFTFATRYDAMRRVVGTIAPDPDGSGPLRFGATRTTYDQSGRIIRVEKGQLSDWQPDDILPENWSGPFSRFSRVDTAYDGLGRKAVERTVGSDDVTVLMTQFSYNGQGWLECTAVRMNPATFDTLPASACALATEGNSGPDRITRNEYDAAGQLLKTQKAYGTALQQDYAAYSWSASGKKTSVTDANGNLAQMSYDAYDRQSRWTFPSSSAIGQVNAADYEEYGYDDNGNRTSLRKRDGRVIAYSYDALNRVISKTFPNGGTRGVFYNYDLRGLQTGARFDSVSGADAVTTAYSGFGEPVSSTTTMGGISRTVGSAYNPDGVRVRMTYPDGQFVSYNRDGLDRFYYADLNAVTPLFHTPWDAAGRVAMLYRLVGGNWSIPTSYGYDGIGRMAALTHAIVGAGVTTNFSYNPANQLASVGRDNDAFAFTGYVNVDRSYTANGLNQYVSAGSAGFTYDPNGNLISDGTTSYAYDVENRLVSTSAGATLTYDPTGRLWQTNGGTGVTQFLYDGDQLAVEYDSAGNIQRRYVHGDGEDDPQVWYEGAGTGSPRYLYANHQGSIVGIADASGSIAAINAYDEYGIPKAGNAVNTSGRFQYTGQAWIPELGMYHYKARIYSPTLGRFLQTDPIGYNDQVNLYAYVANDPVNGADPTGLDTMVTVQKYGVHAYVVLRDTESSATMIVRGGPNGDYLGHYLSPGSAASSGSSSSGGSSSSSSSRVSSGIASGTSAERSQGMSSGSSGRGGLQLVGEARAPSQSLDRDAYNSGNSTVLGSANVTGKFSDTLQAAREFTNSVNSANLDYRLLGQNSNSFAGTAFEQLTGQVRPGNPDMKPLPAYSVDLCKRGVPCK